MKVKVIAWSKCVVTGGNKRLATADIAEQCRKTHLNL